MQARSSDFTNVKVGDKIITDLQYYPYPKLHTDTVERVTKTTFQLQSYEGRPGSGQVYKKDGGVPYPKSYRTSCAIVWTQEIQDEYDAFVARRNECRQLKTDVEKIMFSLAETVKQCDDIGTLGFIKNTLAQAATEITDLTTKES